MPPTSPLCENRRQMEASGKGVKYFSRLHKYNELKCV